MEQLKPEPEPEKEIFKRVEIEIEPPDPIHKNWKISFECGGLGICGAYNSSIKDLAAKKRMAVFHQAGVTNKSEHEPGYHMWEFWVKTDEEKLKELVSEVQNGVEERFNDHEEAGMHEYWKEKIKNPRP